MLILRRGSRGADVSSLQRALAETGDYTGAIDGQYGPHTEAAVKQYQARAGLVADGIAGPITLRHLLPDANPVASYDAPSPWHEAFISAAESQVGVRETGHNAGPEVEAYLASVGLGKGNPYCQAGLHWAAERASKKLGVPNPCLATGHCQTFYNWASRQGYLVDWSKARPGDIGIMLFGGGKGHAFLIAGVISAGNWGTIEFNTNAAGSREGEGVMRRARKYTQVAGVVRLPAPII